MQHFCKAQFNMWTCMVCHSFCAQYLKGLVRHVIMVPYGQPNVDFLCGVQGCVSRYKSCKSWCNHVIKNHKDAYFGTCSSNQATTLEEPTQLQGISPTALIDSGDDDESDLNECKEMPQEHKKRHARILLTFKEKNKLTQKTTDHFVDCVNFFARNIVDHCHRILAEGNLTFLFHQ